ncbi:MAG TPA: helix-turn-helix domain-containing protein [Anaeromyxobacteraceae bacterium]|nr:helix-turn-helix domain-containing protein [Anaeromyxobacteraceae bacterium]
MTPDDLDLAAAIRTVLRHPLVRAELRAIFAEATPPAQAPTFVGTAEAARRWGVKPDTVLAAIADGRLPATKPEGSRSYRIRLADLEAFLAGEGKEPTPPNPVDLEAKRRERAARLLDGVKRGDG